MLTKTNRTANNKSGCKSMYNQTLGNINWWKIALLWLLIGAVIATFFNSATYINHVVSKSDNATFGSTIVTLSILVSGLVFSPLFVFILEHPKIKYKIVLFILFFGLSIFSFAVYPFFNRILLFWIIFFPSFGIFYSFRSLKDSFITLKAEHHKVPYASTRGIFYIGYGLASFGAGYLYQSQVGQIQTPFHYFYLTGALTFTLAFYQLLCFKEPNLAQIRRANQKELFKLADIKKTKVWLTVVIAIIIFSTIVGIYEAQDFIMQRVMVNWSGTRTGLRYKSYADLFAMPFYIVGSFFAAWWLKRMGIRNGIILTVILGVVNVMGIAIFLFATANNITDGGNLQSVSRRVGLDLFYGAVQGFFGSIMWSTFFEFFSIISSRKHRSKLVVTFSGISYGLGTFLVVLITTHAIGTNTFFNNSRVGYTEVGLAAVVALSIISVFFVSKDMKTKLH